jgi:hypothetical protein
MWRATRRNAEPDRYLGQIRRTIQSLRHLPANTVDGPARDRLLIAFHA